MTHLQSIAHKRSQIGKMSTKPGADRWSSHLSVSTLLQMVNFPLIFVYITSSPFPLPVHGTHDYQWLHTHSFAVQPFDHNAITCFPDLMPSLWSILCGLRTFLCLYMFSSQYMIYIWIIFQLRNKQCLCGLRVSFLLFWFGKNIVMMSVSKMNPVVCGKLKLNHCRVTLPLRGTGG